MMLLMNGYDPSRLARWMDMVTKKEVLEIISNVRALKKSIKKRIN